MLRIFIQIIMCLKCVCEEYFKAQSILKKAFTWSRYCGWVWNLTLAMTGEHFIDYGL